MPELSHRSVPSARRSELRQRGVFAPHLVEQGAEQPVGFGRIAVVGEPLLDADLLAVVAAAVEVVPDFI